MPPVPSKKSKARATTPDRPSAKPDEKFIGHESETLHGDETMEEFEARTQPGPEDGDDETAPE